MEINLTIPSVGESITEVTIGEWIKKDGDFIHKGEIICELESEKATFDFTSSHDGILKILKKAGEIVPINAIIAIVKENQIKNENIREDIVKEDQVKEQVNKVKIEIEKEKKEDLSKYPSPASKKIISEKDLDISKIIGSGKSGRIIKEDLLDLKLDNNIDTKKNWEDILTTDSQSDKRSTTEKRMSLLRKTIAKRLVMSKNETAMLTTFNEVDLYEIKNLRSTYQDAYLKKYNVKLGFMSFFTRASVLALQEYPDVNAKIEGDNIIYHNYCDISIAVSIPKGLVTPVIRNAENLSFDEIELKIIDLAKKAREAKLSMDEMLGGTFTITNGGIFGSMLSTPIINLNQSAILGMHNIIDRPVVIGGEIKIRPIMYLALSYDHRIIDGREASGFLYRIKEMIENPIRMLLKV